MLASLSRACAALLAIVVAVWSASWLMLDSPPVYAVPNFVTARGQHFFDPAGRRLFVWGVNYVGGADRSWTMWQDALYDPALIAVDFEKARAAGSNVVRIFIRNPLPADIAAGRWEKLDRAVSLAKQRGLRLLITLYDYAETDLAKVAATARGIGARYAHEDAVFGYDFRNEPHFYDLITAQYQGELPTILGDSLIRAYGIRTTQDQVNAWRLTEEGRRIIPARLSARDAYFVANGYRIYQEFVAASGEWVAARDYAVSTLEFLSAPEAARWQPLLGVLNDAVAAWLRAPLAALRAVDPAHLVTVGYNDPVLAQLPANAALSFASIHRYPAVGAKPLRVAIGTAQRLQRAFPDRPLLIEEFGYSDAGRSPVATAGDEAAFLLAARAADLGGVLKWSLNDVAQGSNEREMRFGLYDVSSTAKPSVARLQPIADYLAWSVAANGKLEMAEGSDRDYAYSAPDALIIAARRHQDGRLAFTAVEPTQVAIAWPPGDALQVAVSGATMLTVNPIALFGDASGGGDYQLSDGAGRPVSFNRAGESVSFPANAGERYRLEARVPLDAKLEIVWPQGNRAVRDADRANVGAYLFQRGSLTALCGSTATAMRLYRAVNNEVERPVATGERVLASAGGSRVATWAFNDVDVSAARNPANRVFFRLGLDGRMAGTNIWSHAADARTFFPQPDVPSGVAAAEPQAVDAKIEIVWPHGNLPVENAEKANVAAYLFQSGTTVSVPTGFAPAVRLWRAVSGGVATEVAVGRRTTNTVGSVTFPVWQFDNVDVSPARDPANRVYFRLTVDGVQSYSNLWAHAKDGRTIFPKMDEPTGSVGCSQ